MATTLASAATTPVLAPVLNSVELSTGVTLPYVEQGDPDGIPVVLVHGYSDSWRSFEPVLPHLPASIRAIAPNQRGHGGVEGPSGDYRLEDLAVDLAALMDALGLGSAVVAGHSMGSYAAQRLAMDYPERVLGLVLAGSVTTWRGNPAMIEIWESGFSTLTDPVAPGFVHEWQASPRLLPAFLDVVVDESLKMPARVWRAAWQAMLATDFSADLGKIEAPTLVVWGNQDPLCPRSEQEALTAAIAGARLVVYPGVGHNLHWEEPRRFAADLVAFAESAAG